MSDAADSMDLGEPNAANSLDEDSVDDNGSEASSVAGGEQLSSVREPEEPGQDYDGNEQTVETDNPGIDDSQGTAVPPPSSPMPPPVEPATFKPTARLLITKMEMENFKSYGGLREIGPFHKCFSSIVGPNGSGKSNVIDAMLFVFGKRAKKLRLNKVSELIHRSDTFPNLEFARVSVHFVDILDVEGSEDEYTEVPGTKLVVTRTAFANNQSKYQVDGKNATWTEVQTLLLQRGVDLEHNRFLILQGEVEQIAMMKPKALTEHEEGLLEYLEEIIGSNRFVEDAELAAKRVEELNDQRSEKLNRLKLAEKEKDGLEGARKDAEEFLTLDAKIRTKSNALYQVHLARAAANVEQITAKEEKLTVRLAHERQKLQTTVAEVKETKKTYDDISAQDEALRAGLAKTKAEYDEYERMDIEFQANNKFFKEQTRKLETAIKKDEKRSRDSLARAEALEEGLGGLQRGVNQADARKASEEAALEEVNESLKGETAELRGELESEQEKAQPVREVAVALRNKMATCQCEINLVQESTESAKKRLSDAETALAALRDKAVSDKKELSAAKRESQAMDQEIVKAEGAVTKAKEQLVAANNTMVQAVAAAEEAKASRESASRKSGALRALLEAAAAGGPLEHAGVCGRLGDLGVVDAKYDVAVSSSSGTLDHVVVDTAEGATACVEFLRVNSVGRLSFLILEKIGHLAPAAERYSGPAGCPRLFDLVQSSDPKFRLAFYMAFRDTLVARDLDTAVANAYDGGRCRHRIVSLDGQLIDRSGAMTGGGNSVKRGSMRTSGGVRGASAGGAPTAGAGIVSAAQAEKLVAVARSAEETVQRARAATREAEGNVKTLHTRGKQLQVLIPKLERTLQGVDASEAQYRQQIEDLQDHCTLSPEAQAQLAELNKVLVKDEKALNKVSTSLQKVESAIQALQKGILEVGGERLKKAVKRADAASKALDEAVEAVNRATVEGKGERKKGEKAAKDAERKHKELAAIKAKAETAERDFEGLEEKAFVVLQKYEAAEEEVKGKGAELTKVVKAYDEARALEDKIREVEVDIVNQLQQYTKVINENKDKMKHWKSQLSKLRKLHKSEAEEWGLDDDHDESDSENDSEDDESVDGDNKEKRDGSDVDESRSESEEGDAENGNARERTRMRKRTGRGQEAKEGYGLLPDLSLEHLDRVDSEKLKLEIGELEAEKKKAEKNVNLTALALYRERERDYLGRVKELEEATVARNEARGRHEELRRQRLEEFMAGFGQITLRLKEMYQMITLGGDAELELVDSLDPFSEGIVFSVRPPKKSWKNIANLSGGEKTLSSLALVFALHHFKPTPLYVMDEIDAALDFKNVSIVANYIKERTKNAQFIIISLRNNMFELADRLVGIYKTHNVTKSVTINPKEFTAAQMASKPKALAATPKVAGVLGDKTNALRATEA